jgi:hypothetical protein
MSNIFFIVGAGRSGTTAIVQTLSIAPNAAIYAEQSPKLCIAARLHHERILPHPKEFIYKSKNEKIGEALSRGKIYGDKNPNYLHFILELSEIWDSRFLFIIRDGRDVVRSCMDFHAGQRPGYARYEDNEDSDLTQPEDDFWDFARLRPKRTAALYRNWRTMQQFEKFAWGWAEFNRILFEEIENLDDQRYRIIDMTNLKPEDVESIFDFLGLRPFDLEKVSLILNSKVNTTSLDKTKRFLHWSEWDNDLLAKFDRYADHAKGLKWSYCSY